MDFELVYWFHSSIPSTWTLNLFTGFIVLFQVYELVYWFHSSIPSTGTLNLFTGFTVLFQVQGL